MTNNVIIGDDVTTGQTHGRANPIYQERRLRTSTSFDLSTMRSTGKPVKGIQPCGRQPSNPTCVESKRIAEAKLKRKKPLRAMEAMIQRQMVGRSATVGSQTSIVQTAEVGIQEVAETQINATQTELSDRMLRNMGVRPLYWEKVRKSTFLAEAMQGILPTDDEVMRSMNQTVDPLLTQTMPEEEETLGEETGVDLDMSVPEEDETFAYGEAATSEQAVTTTVAEEEADEIAPLDMSAKFWEEVNATVVESHQPPVIVEEETAVQPTPAHDLVVINQDDEDEDVQEVPQSEVENQKQDAGWTSNDSEEELPRVLPFRERRQAPTFQMVVGREYRMVRSTHYYATPATFCFVIWIPGQCFW